MGEGAKVRILSLSSGMYQRLDGSWRQREEAITEGETAANILGAELILAEEDDPAMHDPMRAEVHDRSKVTRLVEEMLYQHHVDLLLTMFPFGISRDHRETATASMNAARRLGAVWMWEPMAPDRPFRPFRPQVYVDITDSFGLKMAALRAHVSEYSKPQFGDAWLDGIKGRAMYRGFESQCQFAEAFEVAWMRWPS